jgi:hypothetical protein
MSDAGPSQAAVARAASMWRARSRAANSPRHAKDATYRNQARTRFENEQRQAAMEVARIASIAEALPSAVKSRIHGVEQLTRSAAQERAWQLVRRHNRDVLEAEADAKMSDAARDVEDIKLRIRSLRSDACLLAWLSSIMSVVYAAWGESVIFLRWCTWLVCRPFVMLGTCCGTICGSKPAHATKPSTLHPTTSDRRVSGAGSAPKPQDRPPTGSRGGYAHARSTRPRSGSRSAGSASSRRRGTG